MTRYDARRAPQPLIRVGKEGRGRAEWGAGGAVSAGRFSFTVASSPSLTYMSAAAAAVLLQMGDAVDDDGGGEG